jgi:hypothetical protein
LHKNKFLLDFPQQIPYSNKTSYGKSSNNIVKKQKGWKVGDLIDNLTKAGNEPSWSTVKSRYWPWEHAEIDPYRYYTGPRP